MNPVDKHVGARLMFRRQEMGRTIFQLAESLGLTPAELEAIEAGHVRLSAQMMHQVCICLDVTPGYFFQGLQAKDVATIQRPKYVH